MPAGEPPISPGDAVAGRHFRYVIEEASSRFDLVIVVGSDLTAPATQIQMQRLDGMLLVVAVRQVPCASASAPIVQDFNERNITIQGAVFLEKSRRGVSSAATAPDDSSEEMPRSRSSGPTIEADDWRRPKSQANQLVDRLEREARLRPPETGTEPGTNSASAPSRGTVSGSTGCLSGRRRLRRNQSRGSSHHPCRPGHSAGARQLRQRDGVHTLTRVDGFPKAGDVLGYEFEVELGPVVGPVVSDRIVAVLADGSGLQEADLDGWLTHEFFKRHVERTMGEPVVWHLKSNNGCIQVLVGAQRLDKHRLQLLEKGLVTPRTDLLRRELLAADAHGDEASSALLRAGWRTSRSLEPPSSY